MRPLNPSVHTRSMLFVDVTFQYEEIDRMPWTARFVSIKTPYQEAILFKSFTPAHREQAHSARGVTNTVSLPNEHGHQRPRLTS